MILCWKLQSLIMNKSVWLFFCALFDRRASIRPFVHTSETKPFNMHIENNYYVFRFSWHVYIDASATPDELMFCSFSLVTQSSYFSCSPFWIMCAPHTRIRNTMLFDLRNWFSVQIRGLLLIGLDFMSRMHRPTLSLRRYGMK